MPTSQINLNPNEYAAFSFHGVDSSGIGAAITGTVVIDDYSQAYVARVGTSGLNFVLVPKVPAPTGGNAVRNATIHAVDANGTALPSFQVQALIAGPAGVPLAVSIELMNDVSNAGQIDANTPPDPGSASVSF